uniref:WGS project CAEQ00000000 data, annotated contig 2120 n=1 Tax=Trypanosoma congolense (strain IL3000) TaxID=1068625 RepID=F9WBL8_TRYCI|nr:unnamed protein product [Trypanosoma congolense IL3000]
MVSCGNTRRSITYQRKLTRSKARTRTFSSERRHAAMETLAEEHIQPPGTQHGCHGCEGPEETVKALEGPLPCSAQRETEARLTAVLAIVAADAATRFCADMRLLWIKYFDHLQHEARGMLQQVHEKFSIFECSPGEGTLADFLVTFQTICKGLEGLLGMRDAEKAKGNSESNENNDGVGGSGDGHGALLPPGTPLEKELHLVEHLSLCIAEATTPVLALSLSGAEACEDKGRVKSAATQTGPIAVDRSPRGHAAEVAADASTTTRMHATSFNEPHSGVVVDIEMVSGDDNDSNGCSDGSFDNSHRKAAPHLFHMYQGNRDCVKQMHDGNNAARSRSVTFAKAGMHKRARYTPSPRARGSPERKNVVGAHPPHPRSTSDRADWRNPTLGSRTHDDYGGATSGVCEIEEKTQQPPVFSSDDNSSDIDLNHGVLAIPVWKAGHTQLSGLMDELQERDVMADETTEPHHRLKLLRKQEELLLRRFSADSERFWRREDGGEARRYALQKRLARLRSAILRAERETQQLERIEMEREMIQRRRVERERRLMLHRQVK